MVVKINGEIIDCTLEHEKNALDIVNSILKELKNPEAVISSIDIDGKCYGSDDEELKAVFVDDIKVIDMEVSNKDELIVNLIEESKNILRKISTDLKTNGFAHVKEIQELFQWVSETVQTINGLSVFNMVEAKLMISTLAQISNYINSEQKDSSKIDPLAGILESLIHYLDAIELKISTHFVISKDSVKDAVTDALELLPEISESFQTGKDHEALEKINRIISVLELCCIYLKKNLSSFSEAQQEDIDALYEEINALLIQIVEAFENGDLVLLGDLLEYELPEKLETYKNIILGE